MILLMSHGQQTFIKSFHFSTIKLNLTEPIFSQCFRESIMPLESMIKKRLSFLSLLNSQILSPCLAVLLLVLDSTKHLVVKNTLTEKLLMTTFTVANQIQTFATLVNLHLKRKISAVLSIKQRFLREMKMLRDLVYQWFSLNLEHAQTLNHVSMKLHQLLINLIMFWPHGLIGNSRVSVISQLLVVWQKVCTIKMVNFKCTKFLVSKEHSFMLLKEHQPIWDSWQMATLMVHLSLTIPWTHQLNIQQKYSSVKIIITQKAISYPFYAKVHQSMIYKLTQVKRTILNF